MNWVYVLMILLGAGLSIGPVITSKQYVLLGDNLYIWLGMIMNALLVLVYIKLLTDSDKSGSIDYTIIKIISIILLTIYWVGVYKQELKTSQLVGLGLGCGALYLL